MVARGLADLVVVVHLGFVLFVALGGFLAWRWRFLRPLHVAAVAWGAGIIAIGWDCPLTELEAELHRLGGEATGDAGFIDRYVEGVVYPGELTPYLWVLAGLAVVISWVGWTGSRLPPRSRSISRA